MEGNQYFEQQAKDFIRSISDDELVKRSKECQFVLDKLTDDGVWKIVLKDCKKWVNNLDSKWHECSDDKQLHQMRALKYAYGHLFSLPKKYLEEYKYVVDELKKRENPDVVEKDYDLETNLEN